MSVTNKLVNVKYVKYCILFFSEINCLTDIKFSRVPFFQHASAHNNDYYTSNSLSKIWLVESIQSIHNSLRTWHDKCNIICPLECSPQKQNGWTLRFCFWGWIICVKLMYNKTIIEFGFRMISWIIKTSCLCYLPQPLASADNTDLGFDNSWYHAQPHPIIGHFRITFGLFLKASLGAHLFIWKWDFIHM